MSREVLPIYFREINISRRQASYWTGNGELLPLARGIYIANPLRDEALAGAPEKAAEAINRTLRRFAVRMAEHLLEDPVVGLAAAVTGRADAGPVVIYTTGRAGRMQIGEQLKQHLPPAVAAGIEPVEVERIRIRGKAEFREGRDYEAAPFNDGLESVPGVDRFLKDGERIEAEGRRTTPRRTLLDLARWPDRRAAHLPENEYRRLVLEADLPLGGRGLPARIRSALEALREEFPHMPPEAFEALGDQLASLSRAPAPIGMGEEKERFVLRWHGVPVGQLVCRHDDKWMYYQEPGWKLRLWSEPEKEMFPPFLSSLFPEQRKFSPSERVDFLRRYSRLMSNLTVTRASEPPPAWPVDRIEQPLSDAIDDGVFFRGRTEGIPVYDASFLGRARQIMVSTAATQISGAQIKVPVQLRDDVLRSAENGVFTHILKLPMDNRMRAIPVYEWFGMSLVRAAGVEVPAFSLVELPPADAAASRVPASDRGGRPLLGEAVDRIADTPLPESPGSAIRRLSDELTKMPPAEKGAVFGEAAWDELYRLAAEGVGEMFRPLSDEALAQNVPPAYLVERFDVPTPEDGRWRVAEDFCSLTGRLSDISTEAKYAGSMEEVARVLRAHSSNWHEDGRRLFRQVVGNVLVCNGDAHLKNFSLLRIASRDRERFDEIRLAPAYDVTAMGALFHGTGRQALPIFGEDRPDREVLVHYAVESCGIPRKEADAILDQMILAVRNAAPALIEALPEQIRNDRGLLEGLGVAAKYVLASCAHLDAPTARPSAGDVVRMSL